VKPLEWLRQRTTAAVRITDARPAATTQAEVQRVAPLVVTAIDNQQAAIAVTGELIPTGFIRIDRTLTDTEAEQVRQRFKAALKPEPYTSVPSWSSRCDCWPHYIDCCCYQRKRAVSSNDAH